MESDAVDRAAGPRPPMRWAVPADVERIVDLVDSAYRGETSRTGWTTEADMLGGQRTDVIAVGELLDAADSVILVRDAPGGGLVGCCHLERLSSRTAKFGMFAVAPCRQGSGIGAGLLAEAERLVVEDWGCERLRMSVLMPRLELMEWYRRRGYESTGEREPFPYGEPRFGLPKRGDLVFAVLVKDLARDLRDSGGHDQPAKPPAERRSAPEADRP